jgi:hypothetical protein
MRFYRKVLIFIVILLSILLVVRFMQKRMEILSKSNKVLPAYLESFFSANTAETEAETIQKQLESVPVGIVNIPSNSADLPLNQYFIKGSANSAYSGSFVSTNMLKVVLSRGCRFLDFQVFASKDSKTGDTIAVVGVKQPDGTVSKNQIPLVDVFKTILVSGMNSDSPNTKDPLFIQLRIIPSPQLYEIIGTHVNKYLATTPFFYTPSKDEFINSKTPLNKISNKMVLAIDVGLTPDYMDPKKYKDDRYNLKHFVSMETNTSDIPSYESYDMAAINITAPVFVNPTPNHKTTNISKFTIVNPGKDMGSNPREYKSFVKDHGYNVILYQFDLIAINGPLGEYETIFGAKDGIHRLSDFRSAFIPMADMIHWIKSSSK